MSSTPPDDSVCHWLDRLKDGSPEAPQQLWERYFEKLVHLARRRMHQIARRAVDEEDVAISAFHSFFEGVKAGRFPQLESREDLWKILVVITSRKAAGVRRAAGTAKRGRGSVRGESVFHNPDSPARDLGLQDFAGKEPTPEFAAAFAEEYSLLLAKLGDPVLRTVAVRKMEGATNAEIAKLLGVQVRTVERKLERIRGIWGKELEGSGVGFQTPR